MAIDMEQVSARDADAPRDEPVAAQDAGIDPFERWAVALQRFAEGARTIENIHDKDGVVIGMVAMNASTNDLPKSHFDFDNQFNDAPVDASEELSADSELTSRANDDRFTFGHLALGDVLYEAPQAEPVAA